MSFDYMCRLLKPPWESRYRTSPASQISTGINTTRVKTYHPSSPFSFSIYNRIFLNSSSSYVTIHISVLLFAQIIQQNLENSRGKGKSIVFIHILALSIALSTFLMFPDILPLSKTSSGSSFRIGLLVKILFIFLCLTVSSFPTEMFV